MFILHLFSGLSFVNKVRKRYRNNCLSVYIHSVFLISELHCPPFSHRPELVVNSSSTKFRSVVNCSCFDESQSLINSDKWKVVECGRDGKWHPGVCQCKGELYVLHFLSNEKLICHHFIQ